MKSLRDRIQFAYEGGLVTRFHTRSGIKPSTDAAHSHGVAMLCFFLWEGSGNSDYKLAQLLMAALTHDLAEQSVGDVPAPTKWAVPGMAAQLEEMENTTLARYGLDFGLNESEQRILKLADSLEGLLYCASEASTGNRKSWIMGNRWVEFLLKITQGDHPYNPHQLQIINAVIEVWEDARDGEEPADFTQFETVGR